MISSGKGKGEYSLNRFLSRAAKPASRLCLRKSKMRWGTRPEFLLCPVKVDRRVRITMFAQAPLCLASLVCWPPLPRQDSRRSQEGSQDCRC